VEYVKNLKHFLVNFRNKYFLIYKLKKSAIFILAQWTEWYIWSKCSASCGVGFRERKRICQIGIDKERCDGNNNEISVCYNELCQETTPNPVSQTVFKNKFAINGKWSEWTEWDTDCHLCKIQSGNLKRTRKCNNPSPFGGGKKCYGLDTEYKSCYDSIECSKYFRLTTFVNLLFIKF
jgi:hypothetical protein